MIVYALIAAAGWLAATALLLSGLRRIPRLERGGSGAPDATVAVVVAARNEERDVERAARSLLAQRHPSLRVVAVDDRSEDSTGAILDGLAAEDPRLDVIHVSSVPPGWLGKNHALQSGADAARAEWLLFADADIVMDPDAVGGALAHAEERRLDHAAVFPRMRARGLLLNAAVGVFTLLFALRFRPWLASDPSSGAYVGVGAFNLVRRAAYERIGGHSTISLRPDDDLRLGRALKEAGFRSEAVYGGRFLEVEWYRSIPEMVRGLRKNAYAAADYDARLVALLVALLLAFHVVPFFAVFFTSGVARAGFALASVLALACFGASAARFGVRVGAAPLYPFGALVVGWAIVAATVRALASGGVEWRGTVYPLARLRGADGVAERRPTR